MDICELSVVEKNKILLRYPDAFYVEPKNFPNLALLHYRDGGRTFVHRLAFKTSPRFHGYRQFLDTLIILEQKNKEKCFFKFESMESSVYQCFDESEPISDDLVLLTKSEVDKQLCFFNTKTLKYSTWVFGVTASKVEGVAGVFWLVEASDGAKCFFNENTMSFSIWFLPEESLQKLPDSNQFTVVSEFKTTATFDLLTFKLSHWRFES